MWKYVDGRSYTTTFTNWYRGIPKNISFPVGSVSAAVNTDGTISSTTDENGYTTQYTYHSGGRLKSIAYPVSDTTTWLPTDFTYTQVLTTEHGIGPGHWKLFEQTGNARKYTYFDGLWRPVLSRNTTARPSQRPGDTSETTTTTPGGQSSSPTREPPPRYPRGSIPNSTPWAG